MSFTDIALELLNKPNCSLKGVWGVHGTIYNLHKEVRLNTSIIHKYRNPKESFQCVELKRQMMYILDNYNTSKKGAANSKP